MNTLRKIPPVQLTLMAILIMVASFVIVIKFAARAQDTSAPASVDQDIGEASKGGSEQISAAGVYSISSSGTDIWNQADSFHYSAQPLNGNGEIVARVIGIQATNGFAKAGVMIRETLDAGSRNAMMLLALNQGTFFQSRSTAGKQTAQLIGVTNQLSPYWVKLVRSGDWLGGYGSTDGTNWTLVGWQNMGGLAAQMYAGLAVSGHDSQGASSEGWFDQVTVGPVNPEEVIRPLIGTGDGLAASYYDNRHLFGTPVVTRVDPQVDFDWKALVSANTPKLSSFVDRCNAILGMPKAQEFGVRWVGEIQPQFTEPYILHVTSDDGVRVWLNEQLVIDDWNTHSSTESLSSPINLVAGKRYLVRIEYFQNRFDAMIQMAWSSPSTPYQVVPQSQLYSQPIDADGNGLPDAWELHYFGQTGVDPNADPDGDGLTNLQEYRQFSNPIDPMSPGMPKIWWQGDSGSDMGKSTLSNGVVTVTTRGEDLWGHFDSFHYTYRMIGTNDQIITRLLGLSGPNPWMKAGLMIRETLAGGSRNVAMLMTRSNGMDFQWRPATDGETLQYTTDPTNSAAACWLKLSRNGDWVGAFTSPDGTNWTLFDWETVEGLAPQVYAGLAVSSLSEPVYSTAWFDQISVGPARPAEILNPLVGSGDGLMGNYRSDSLLYLPGVTNRLDSIVGFDWEHQDFEQLPSMIDPNSYGICWSGEIQAQLTEPYTFVFECHDEEWVRIWLNEKLIVDGWRRQHSEGRLASLPLNLIAGQRYLIRIEVYDAEGRGRARLKWSSPSTPEMPVPSSQLYSVPTDTDGNGLPDLWEQIYFGHTGVDPAADPDGDGLSNLQEYRYHTNPTKADTDKDGIPDAWEIAHTLDPQFNDAGFDYNNSGQSNLQKYQQGLDPFNTDIDGDGVPDYLEEKYLGLGPTVSHAGVATVVATINGAQATNFLGTWQVDGTDIYALDRRGAVEFVLTTTNADKYVLNIVGTQNEPNPWQTSLRLLLSVDGQTLGHYILNAGGGTNGIVELALPYLQAGSHTLRVFWDGAADFSSLRIKQIKLLAVSGQDADRDGIKDWIEKMVSDESGLDLAGSAIGSYTSPICLEGVDPYPLMQQMSNNQVALLSTGTSDKRWYVNVPLSANTQSVFQATFQNGALSQTRILKWLPINLLTVTSNLTIRAGDSLLFYAQPTNGASGNFQVTIGTNTYTGKTTQPIAYRFTTSGTYLVDGTYSSPSAKAQNGSIAVNVLKENLPNAQPAVWVGMQRRWNLLNVPPEAALQADSRLTCFISATNSSGGVQLNLAADQNEPRSVLARLGAGGAILDSVQAQGFNFYAGNQAYTRVLQVYPDGSQLVEELIISSPVVPDVTFQLDIIVAGVIFDDGTTSKTLSAADFDALGQCKVRFIRPSSAVTSVCHSYKAYQGSYQIGYRH